MTRKELEQHICSTLNISSLTPIINSQISKFVTERGLNYETIARAVSYFTEVEKTPYQAKFGIGLIPYVVDKANAYYAAIEAQKKAQLKSVTIASSTPEIILVASNLQKRKAIDPIDITKLDEGSGE
jgi:hypothetical protein